MKTVANLIRLETEALPSTPATQTARSPNITGRDLRWPGPGYYREQQFSQFWAI